MQYVSIVNVLTVRKYFPITAESESMTTAEIPTLAADSQLETTSKTTSISGIDKAINEGQDQYTQDVLIGVTVTGAVLGATQVLVILAVILLTVAVIYMYIHKKYKKDVKESPHLQMKTNSAYGAHEAGSQVVYDFI